MSNPWEEIILDDYEKHMSLDSVRQLQALDSIMKEQFAAYPVETAAVLGVAGGNGLEHIGTDKHVRKCALTSFKVGDLSHFFLDPVHAFFTALVDRTRPVTEGDVLYAA